MPTNIPPNVHQDLLRSLVQDLATDPVHATTIALAAIELAETGRCPTVGRWEGCCQQDAADRGKAYPGGYHRNMAKCSCHWMTQLMAKAVRLVGEDQTK